MQAWEEFKKGKRKKKGVGEFEFHLEDNLFVLHKRLVDKTYRHGKYSGFYLTDPKLRHIHKAKVIDRVVHHALFMALNPIFEPSFISDSYACRKGYGTHKGFQKLVVYCRKVSKNYTQECWALKSDIKKFFDSVDHKILFEIIAKRIKDKELLWLISEIIESYPNCHPDADLSVSNLISGSKMLKQEGTPHTASPQHDEGKVCKGIPIGNLTSQLFANIYLNELDQFVKHRLKAKYYLRYADDFVILHENMHVLKKYLKDMNFFLVSNLQLDLHPRKTIFRKLSWGIDFVGFICLPYYKVVRTKTKNRICKKVGRGVESLRTGKITEFAFYQSIASYNGVLRHAYSNKIIRRINKIMRKINY